MKIRPVGAEMFLSDGRKNTYEEANRRERDHWGDLDVDGWIILGRISRRWDVSIWTGLGWPRVETVGGRLWVP